MSDAFVAGEPLECVTGVSGAPAPQPREWLLPGLWT